MNTTLQGNRFRDVVASLMRAGGYKAETEQLCGGKAVDVLASKRMEMQGETITAIEAKDYAAPLPLTDTMEFIHAYSSMTRNNHADLAILVTKKGLTSQGYEAIKQARGDRLKHLTWDELQRELFGADDYLRSRIAEYESSEIDEYYILPRDSEGNDLRTVVDGWLDEPSPPPLLILGGYGIGKSTFAQKLCFELAKSYIDDVTRRIPIYVPLGEIVEENTLAGLFGKILSSKYRVTNYHFSTLRELNRLGRLVIIFDGLDEMKHGMTFQAFKRQYAKLIQLHERNSHVLILGRPNVFPSEQEFKAVIKGKQSTPSGAEINLPGQVECRDLRFSEFSREEAERFIESYFRWFARKQGVTDDFIEERLKVLHSQQLRHLTIRPVHAQMLCQIATDSENHLEAIDQFRLYDIFVSFLLFREVSKPGRYPNFDIIHRRRFNAGVSWWLMTKGGASSTTLDDVPDYICENATRDVGHEFDSFGLKSELTAGCLIEKVGGTVYFGHRSIQEFLAAEYLFETSLLAGDLRSSRPVEEVCSFSSAEMNYFLGELFRQRPNGRERAIAAVSSFCNFRGSTLITSVGPYVEALRCSDDSLNTQSPWGYLLRYAASFTPNGWGEDALNYLMKVVGNKSADAEIWLIAVQQICIEVLADRKVRALPIVAALLDMSNVASYVESARYRPTMVRSDDYTTSCFISSIQPIRDPEYRFSFSVNKLLSRANILLGFGPYKEDYLFKDLEWRFNPQQLYSLSKKRSDELEAVRRFFNEQKVIPNLKVVEVDVVGRRGNVGERMNRPRQSSASNKDKRS